MKLFREFQHRYTLWYRFKGVMCLHLTHVVHYEPNGPFHNGFSVSDGSIRARKQSRISQRMKRSPVHVHPEPPRSGITASEYAISP